MNKFWIVLAHTFVSKLKTKTFIISTIVTGLLVAILINITAIVGLFDTESKPAAQQVAVVDESQEIYEALEQWQSSLDENQLQLAQVESEKVARELLDDQTVEAVLVVDMDGNGLIQAQFKTLQLGTTPNHLLIEQGLSHVQTQFMATSLGLAGEEVSLLNQPPQLERIAVSEGARSEEELIQSTILVYILLFAIYFAVLLFGNMVAMEVAKEKSSRVMEILISSVHPVWQLFGKILGVALLGLAQFGLFIGIGVLSFYLGSQRIELGFVQVNFSDIPATTIIFAIVFFLLGYLFYSTIAAMLGSLVSRVEELNAILTPLTILIVMGFLLAMLGLYQPDALFVVISSYIPIFTPMLMFLRVGVGNPAAWEVALGCGILVASIIITAIYAARVYKGGVLMYGPQAKIRDILKAIKMGKGS